MICKNCATACTDKFCQHCGQATDTNRLTVKELLSGTLFSLLNIERGFVFTVKEMCVRPGNAIAEYINGHRVAYYPPHKYVLLIGAVATFFAARYYFYAGQSDAHVSLNQIHPFLNGFFRYADTYTTVINIVTIPVFALFSWWFRPILYNYAENIVLNTFITSQQLLLFIAMVPIFEISTVPEPYLLTSYILITLVYNVWVYKQFFRLHNFAGVVCAAIVMFAAYVCQFVLNLLCFGLAQNLFSCNAR